MIPKSGTSMAQQFVTALRLAEAKQIMADMRLVFERRLRNIPLPSLIRDSRSPAVLIFF